ncbi:MAG: pyridoxamine 5'-phosphate oxidase family protein [Deltaproteobacteria bacterium]|jgi:uncharacterized pyridoxamine 5'-phosphate oxidase family protein|nr:pyridoxamine 5'-phosphate oxidase family protein [Deltaproteobacteria bacterium]
MDSISKYKTILGNTNTIALATSVMNNPNVRIVNFYFNQKQPNILYFASDRKNCKVEEFTRNNIIAFTSIPNEGIHHVRSVKATVQKSKQTINDMAQSFISAIPGYDETINAIGDTLDVFEIHISEAMVISDFEKPTFIKF